MCSAIAIPAKGELPCHSVLSCSRFALASECHLQTNDAADATKVFHMDPIQVFFKTIVVPTMHFSIVLYSAHLKSHNGAFFLDILLKKQIMSNMSRNAQSLKYNSSNRINNASLT